MQHVEQSLETISLEALDEVVGGLPGETWRQFGERYGGAIGGYLGPLGTEVGRDLGNRIGGYFDPPAKPAPAPAGS